MRRDKGMGIRLDWRAEVDDGDETKGWGLGWTGGRRSTTDASRVGGQQIDKQTAG
jgi:hypothetical protein